MDRHTCILDDGGTPGRSCEACEAEKRSASRRPTPDVTLTPTITNAIEAAFDNTTEAHTLLDLINAEFQSDPMSVQCFDLRVVERVKLCVAQRHRLKATLGAWLP